MDLGKLEANELRRLLARYVAAVEELRLAGAALVEEFPGELSVHVVSTQKSGKACNRIVDNQFRALLEHHASVTADGQI